ncbi:MAG: aminotransferase class I/II-fold pyridoxal phosphate-dependent enzyme, partial [Bacilli bacterium]
MLSNEITKKASQGSYIRKVFELGLERAKEVGMENIFDFSIGNPIYEPPQAIIDSIIKRASDPGIHRYMPNAGHFDVRQAIAFHYQTKSKIKLDASNVIMSSGAAGALNISLKAILNPEDEVIIITPYFPEYPYYVENFLGKPIIVEGLASCQINIEGIRKAISTNTKAIIINTPNNPSGIIYQEEDLITLNQLLLTYEQPIYVILDEPYEMLCYEGITNPNTLGIFKNAIYCNSFSKSLNLPGERVGFVIVSSQCYDQEQLVNNIIFCNRTLGFCNANSLFQKVIMDNLDLPVDISKYQANQY